MAQQFTMSLCARAFLLASLAGLALVPVAFADDDSAISASDNPAPGDAAADAATDTPGDGEVASDAQAPEAEEEQGEESNISLVLNTEFVTRYLWRGFDLFPNNGPGVSEEFYFEWDTGLYLGVWAIQALESENFDSDEVDYYIGYTASYFEEQPYELEMDLSYLYYDFPRVGREADSHEVGVTAKFPRLIPVGEELVAPLVGFANNWAVEDKNSRITWLRFGLALTPKVPVWSVEEGQSEDALELTAETYYVMEGDYYEAKDGFSHLVFGASVPILSWKGVSFTPSAFYQRSFESTVNPDDEFWVGAKLSFTYPSGEPEEEKQAGQ